MKKNLERYNQGVVIIFIVVALAITFETFQQLFYIKRFQISNNATFWGVLYRQSLSWLIWLLFSSLLVWYTSKKPFLDRISKVQLLQYTLVIFGLALLDVLMISAIRYAISNNTFRWDYFFAEYVQFFTFQKFPIYTLGYLAVAFISNLYFNNKKLLIQVLNLSELKVTSEKLYKELKEKYDDKASVLSIKIGNKRKIISIANILWIEADDYCVIVHSVNNSSYTMRSSLKALSEKLNRNFLRVHRSAIVNMNMVKEIELKDNPCLIMVNDNKIPISKTYNKAVRNYLT